MKWEKRTLGELTASTRPICYGVLKPGGFIDDGIPLVRVTDISKNHFDSTNLYRISASLDEEFARSRIEGGEILLSIQGTVGRVAIAPPEMKGANISRTIAIISPDERVNRQYLYHYLRRLGDASGFYISGTTRASLNISELRSIEIPLPPLEEQRRIAAILDKATELEVLSMKQSRLLEDAEKHLFLEYFGSPFPGKTPWPVAQLGELGSLERGISKHRPRNDPTLMDGPYPFIQTGDVAGCRGKITTFSATYSEKGLAQSRLWPAGTLCITIAANIAKTGILDFDACFPDSVVGFQERSPAIITYVQCWMSFLQGHIEQMAPESAQKNINLEILRGLSVPVPSEDRLKKFHVAILSLRCTWTRSTQRRGQTAELKSSLQSVFFAA
jgi:type I restriction enzyme S subunit